MRSSAVFVLVAAAAGLYARFQIRIASQMWRKPLVYLYDERHHDLRLSNGRIQGPPLLRFPSTSPRSRHLERRRDV